MQPTTHRAMLAIILGMVLVRFAGCGGGGGSPADPAQLGTVTGLVMASDIDNGDLHGLEGAEVTIANQTGISDSDGHFSVIDIPAGQQQLIVVTLPDPYVLLTGEPMHCDVTEGAATDLSEPIIAIPEDMGVPDPPSL